jgi:multidrug efflux pump subunit AcrA (membrane-fusion protein)
VAEQAGSLFYAKNRRSFMPSRARVVLTWLLRQVPTLVVLCCLLAVGIWGRSNEWKLPSWASLSGGKEKDSDKDKDKARAEEDEEKKDPTAMTLDEDGARNAGLQHAPARQQALSQYVEAPAFLDFDHILHAHLAPRTTGTAWRVLRHEGDIVKKGDVLALIVAESVGKAKAEFLTAWISHEVKRKTLQRLQSAGDSISERQLREAELLLREAKVRLVNAQQVLVNVGLPLRLQELRDRSDDEVARKVRLLGLPSLAALAGEGEGHSPKHEQPPLPSEEDIPGNLLPILAPFDGLVVRHEMNIGEVVGPTNMVFLVSDVRRLSVMLDVRQEDAPRLALGQEVTFRANATSQAVSGELKWISAEVDPKTRTVRARAAVYNPTGQLRPATFGKASVLVQRRGAALTVPDSALQWTDGTHRVFVRTNDTTYEPRIALLGIRAKGRTELLDTRPLWAASLAGSFSSSAGVLPALTSLSFTRRLLQEVKADEQVVTTGSHVLKSELLKNRISGED